MLYKMSSLYKRDTSFTFCDEENSFHFLDVQSCREIAILESPAIYQVTRRKLMLVWKRVYSEQRAKELRLFVFITAWITDGKAQCTSAKIFVEKKHHESVLHEVG